MFNENVEIALVAIFYYYIEVVLCSLEWIVKDKKKVERDREESYLYSNDTKKFEKYSVY